MTPNSGTGDRAGPARYPVEYHPHMETERYEHRHLDMACQLGESDTVTRMEEWATVRGRSVRTELISGGVRVWLPTESGDLVRDLARREAQCCGFLDIEVAVQGDQVRLDITSTARSTAPLIQFLSE